MKTEKTERKMPAKACGWRSGDAQTELLHVNRFATAGQLSASIVHEIRQPLAAIVINASACLKMLGSDSPDIDGARATARCIIRDANRASDVINKSLALFSRNAAPTDSLHLNELVEEAAMLALNELHKNQIDFRSELANDLCSIAGDRVQLQQVILNLLANACDALSTVGNRPRQLTITTKNSDDATQVVLTVQDSGPGIDAADLERIFDPFYSSKVDGLGIGLAICRTIIETHGGKICAKRGRCCGAVFEFTLPAKNKPSRIHAKKTA